MAPIVIVAPTILRSTMKHTVAGGHRADVIIDVSVDEVATAREAAITATAPKVRDAWQSTIVGAFTTNVNFLGSHYIDLDSPDGTTGELGYNGSLIHAGTTAGACTPPNVAFLVHKSAGATRGTRNGRMYLPGVRESDTNDDGTLVAGIISTLNTGLTALRTALNAITPGAGGGTVAWRVVHVIGHDGVPAPGYPNGKPNAWNSSDVVTSFVDPVVATQRRRLR